MAKSNYTKLINNLIYEHNPSVLGLTFETKNQRVFVKNNQALVITDKQTGELFVGQQSATFIRPELVDTDKFIKIYTAGVDELMNLSASALKVFRVIYLLMQTHKDTDLFTLDYKYLKSKQSWGWSLPTFNNGLNELLNKGILFKSTAPSQYFINVKYFFNGNRINIVKSYQLKQSDLLENLEE